MGWLEVGDTWGHSLLPRLTGSHSLTTVHELLIPERIAVSGSNGSLRNLDPAGTCGLQLCPIFPAFQSQGAQAGTELPVLPHAKESTSMPFPKGKCGDAACIGPLTPSKPGLPKPFPSLTLPDLELSTKRKPRQLLKSLEAYLSCSLRPPSSQIHFTSICDPGVELEGDSQLI